MSPLIDGSPMSAVAWGIEEFDCLLWAILLALARRRLVVFGGDEDIWRRRTTTTTMPKTLWVCMVKQRTRPAGKDYMKLTGWFTREIGGRKEPAMMEQEGAENCTADRKGKHTWWQRRELQCNGIGFLNSSAVRRWWWWR